MQLGTIFVNHCDNGRCNDGKKLKYHAATNSNICQGSKEQKLTNLMSDYFTQLINDMEGCYVKQKEVQNDSGDLFYLLQKPDPKHRVVFRVQVLKVFQESYKWEVNECAERPGNIDTIIRCKEAYQKVSAVLVGGGNHCRQSENALQFRKQK